MNVLQIMTRWMASVGPSRLRMHPSCVALGVGLCFAAGCRPDPPAPLQPPSTAVSGSNATESSTAESPRRVSSLRALKLLEGSRFDEAWEECQKVLLSQPNDARALYVAANVLHERDKLDQALQMIDRIPKSDPEYGLRSHRDAVQWCSRRALLSESERRARELLEVYPRDISTLQSLASQLDLLGRRYESSLWMQRLVAVGRIDINTLVLSVDTTKPVNADEVLIQLMKEHPEQPQLQGSLAFAKLFEKQPDEAERLFRALVRTSDAPAAFTVGLGLSLMDQEKFDAIPEWLANAPASEMTELPDYWRLLGRWYQHREAYEEAIHCFTRCVELDPMNHLAMGPLSQCLLAVGRTQEAAEAEALFQRTQLANRNVNYARDGFRKPDWMSQVADALESAGRGLEALAWRELSLQANQGDPQEITRLAAAREERSRTWPGAEGRSPLSWQSKAWPAPDLKSISAAGPMNAVPERVRTLGSTQGSIRARLHWTDVAASLGVNFQYVNGDDPDVLGMQTYQSNGAGASCIDFDRDGWPDLYALQGGGDPRQPESNLPCGLFWNRSGQSFRDVAPQAGVTNRAYGQGAAVGDWDQDGFPDLFVLNFGQNRLYHNLGDGTFEECIVPDMQRDVPNAPAWSVSGAIADIDGDHLPDLIEINYASGIDVITHLCFSQQKVPQVCRPTEFPASKDFLYLSDGESHFRIANDDWGMELDEGRGLGVIVGNLDGRYGNDVYIANDMSANNFLMSRPRESPSAGFQLADEAVRRGCAVDTQGKPQASMGVGCADIDRNGMLDLFMTNFIDEYNALYVQSRDHFFQDASRRYGWVDPKKKTLGFGTQLFDLDLDGWHDALVVNGHVDDYTAAGQPYRMRPQLFLQRNNAFAEQSASELGEFFERETLARSLGAWDFNRDGRIDWYVTHLDQPLSILRNDGSTDGKWLALGLVGVESERDAIGAVVRVRAGEQEWMHQRLAGNGFECANEPWVHLGLGGIERIDSVEIQWPSGKKSLLSNVLPNRRYLAIESLDTLTEDPLAQSTP